jgi:hypothetical protein
MRAALGQTGRAQTLAHSLLLVSCLCQCECAPLPTRVRVLSVVRAWGGDAQVHAPRDRRHRGVSLPVRPRAVLRHGAAGWGWHVSRTLPKRQLHVCPGQGGCRRRAGKGAVEAGTWPPSTPRARLALSSSAHSVGKACGARTGVSPLCAPCSCVCARQGYFEAGCEPYPPLDVNNGTACRWHATELPLVVPLDEFDVALGNALRHIGMPG